MQMVSFLWTGQANRKKYSSKSHFSLCYASACETNTRMMQKNIKEKKIQNQTQKFLDNNSLCFSMKAFSNCQQTESGISFTPQKILLIRTVNLQSHLTISWDWIAFAGNTMIKMFFFLNSSQTPSTLDFVLFFQLERANESNILLGQIMLLDSVHMY